MARQRRDDARALVRSAKDIPEVEAYREEAAEVQESWVNTSMISGSTIAVAAALVSKVTLGYVDPFQIPGAQLAPLADEMNSAGISAVDTAALFGPEFADATTLSATSTLDRQAISTLFPSLNVSLMDREGFEEVATSFNNPTSSDYPPDMPAPLRREDSDPPPLESEENLDAYGRAEPPFTDEAKLEVLREAFEIPSLPPDAQAPSPPATAPAVDMELPPEAVQVAEYDPNAQSTWWGQWTYNRVIAGTRLENVIEAIGGVMEVVAARVASGSVSGTQEEDEDEEEERDEL